MDRYAKCMAMNEIRIASVCASTTNDVCNNKIIQGETMSQLQVKRESGAHLMRERENELCQSHRLYSRSSLPSTRLRESPQLWLSSRSSSSGSNYRFSQISLSSSLCHDNSVSIVTAIEYFRSTDCRCSACRAVRCCRLSNWCNFRFNADTLRIDTRDFDEWIQSASRLSWLRVPQTRSCMHHATDCRLDEYVPMRFDANTWLTFHHLSHTHTLTQFTFFFFDFVFQSNWRWFFPFDTFSSFSSESVLFGICLLLWLWLYEWIIIHWIIICGAAAHTQHSRACITFVYNLNFIHEFFPLHLISVRFIVLPSRFYALSLSPPPTRSSSSSSVALMRSSSILSLGKI